MQQGLQARHRVKIPTLVPDDEVLDEERSCHHMLAKLAKLIRKEDHPSVGHRELQHCYDYGEESPDTPAVELQKKLAELKFPAWCPLYRMPLIRYPLITKKVSTPVNTPGSTHGKAW